MKRNKRILKRNERGITLIALVITIIVLLILAGVSIAMLTGENGILTQATNAKNKTEVAQEKEKIQLAVSASQMKDNDMKITKEDLEYELQQQFNDNFNLIDNRDDSFLVTINNSERMYYINEDGKVIDNSNILKITTAKELEDFRNEVNNGNSFIDKAVLLMNDIILENDWTPIGYINDESIVKFNGDFNGLNHKINNLNVNNPQKLYQGLFANTGSSAKVNSVVVTGSVTGGKYVGGIVGYNEGSIRNCGNEASVTCQYDADGDWNPYTGGIAGYNYNGNINGCYNKGQINSEKYSIGGIAGKSDGGKIKNCYNNAMIVTTRGGEAGGICGRIDNTILYNLYNTGNISTGNVGVAGIRGLMIGNSIKNAYNTGKIESKGNTGGVVGGIKNGVLESSYNKAEIISNETAAGIVGQSQSGEIGRVKIIKCYFYGNVKTPGTYRGTIIGQINFQNLTQNCEWYTEDQEYYNSMIGKTSIKFNENIDMKSVLEVVNEENFFVSNGDDNSPKLYWE